MIHVILNAIHVVQRTDHLIMVYWLGHMDELITGPGWSPDRFPREQRRHFSSQPASSLPEVSADVVGEDDVDDGVGCRVERRQALDEGGHGDHGLRMREVAEHLQQVEHDVRAPAQDEHCRRTRKQEAWRHQHANTEF